LCLTMINKKEVVIFGLLFLFLIPLISATTTLGTYKLNECVELRQTCASCSYVNFTRVSYPNSTIALGNVQASQSGSLFTYQFCNTSALGVYIVDGIGDVDGTDTIFVYDFEVTLSGNKSPEGIVIVIFSIIFIAMVVFGIVYFLKCLARVVEFDMDLIDTAYLMSIYFAIWIFHAFSYDYLGNTLIYDLLDIFIKIGAFTHVFLAIVGFMVSYIVTTLRFKQKQKTTY
jgi:hypothetical protein